MTVEEQLSVWTIAGVGTALRLLQGWGLSFRGLISAVITIRFSRFCTILSFSVKRMYVSYISWRIDCARLSSMVYDLHVSDLAASDATRPSAYPLSLLAFHLDPYQAHSVPYTFLDSRKCQSRYHACTATNASSLFL